MNILKSVFSTILVFASILSYSQINRLNHNVIAKINPEKSTIDVEDKMALSILESKKITFELNSELTPYFNSDNITLKKLDTYPEYNNIGMDRDAGKVYLNRWEITFLVTSEDCVIKYKGKIKSSLKQSNANYQRGFSESAGIISSTGIYLAGSTYWVPTFGNIPTTFTLKTILPSKWKSVSQGKRTISEDRGNLHLDTWVCDNPQEEIFLIGAEFHEYSNKMNNGVLAMSFLRTPDESLANKYQEVTEQYMTMYEGLIDKYPYSKFALVENFWETGYGMPSFTLLGERIIRFPFILHSSYPHELLHNWWGNSVYVNFNKGNWCEGLTAYLADHLIKEQRGQGHNYRRSTLQKFTDFVTPENDFPLSEFVSRHDGASEAIGYGKALMMFHMLRQKIGDKAFVKGLQIFNKNRKYKLATYNNIKAAMQKASGKDLKNFFKTWIERKGAPEIAMLSAKKKIKNGKNTVFVIIEQKQKDNVFKMDVPVYVQTDKGVVKATIKMNKKKQGKYIEYEGELQKVAIDPFYDVFRTLDPKEVPPALSKIWASKKNLIILPSNVSEEQSRINAEFAQKWMENDNDEFEIVFDKELTELPKDKTAWIVGFENKFAGIVKSQLEKYESGFDSNYLHFGTKKLEKTEKEFAITVFDPNDYKKQIFFVALGKMDAVAGLVRKLPHYGKYSYLGFEGDEPTNIAKGQWSVLNSPLEKAFIKNSSPIKEERKALAYLKPVFSKERIMSHVNYLASPELKGRGLGTPELDKAADYIADLFKRYGLKHMDESYFQEFKHKFKEKGKLKLKNVIGVIPGTDSDLKEAPIVVSAHYDHLGLGWPDVHAGDEGKIHYGADDNASGVAILLELAKSMGKSLKPKRTIIFAAFTGEEAGLIGSRYFVNNFKSNYTNDAFANVNIDTDGRLFDKKLIVLNANTAREWKFIFMGTDYTTGVKSQVIEKELDSSDQLSFIEKGIPAIQLFTGANQDYHKPTDTPNKLDGEGMVKVTTVAKEVVEYLADRTDAMDFTGSNKSNAPTHPKKSTGKRKAATGSIPDFGYTGKGVKISSVVDGSAGAKAGLKAGDIITSLNGVKVDGLKAYSDELKKYKPNDKVELIVDRNGKTIKIDLVLGAR